MTMVLSTGNSRPLVLPATSVIQQEVVDGPNNAVYGTSPPTNTPFTLVISTTFVLTIPNLQLTFTGPSGQTFIANPSDFFVGQTTIPLLTQYPPNTYVEYTPAVSLFNEPGIWKVTLSYGNQSSPTVTYQLGIGGILPPTAIGIIPTLPNYAARGVSFAGSIQKLGPTYLWTPALQCVDTGDFSFSFWAKGLNNTFNNGCTLFVGAPTTNYAPVCGTQGTSSTSQFQMTMGIVSSGKSVNYIYNPHYSANDPNWHHYLGSYYTNRPAGQKLAALYIDDILTTPTFSDGASAFVTPIAGLPFYLGDDLINLVGFPTFPGFGPTVALSDVWIRPGEPLLENDGTIKVNNRRIFTDQFGNPVNPSTFPQSAILFTGSASSFGSNFGNGGPFALVGSLGDVLGPGGLPA